MSKSNLVNAVEKLNFSQDLYSRMVFFYYERIAAMV